MVGGNSRFRALGVSRAWCCSGYHSSLPALGNVSSPQPPTKFRPQEKGANGEIMSEKRGSAQQCAGRSGADSRAGLCVGTAAVAGLFLAVGTEGLSNRSRPWVGGQVAYVRCVSWEPRDNMDCHNGSRVIDSGTCHGRVGGRVPCKSIKVEEPAGTCQ